MASLRRPVVWIHAHEKDDTNVGFKPEFTDVAGKYFDLVTSADVAANQKLANEVEGALIGRYNLLMEQLDRLPNLKYIANFGVGVNHIDIAGLAARGIKVANTPGVLGEAVADMALTLILASARGLVQGVKVAMGTKDLSEFNQNILGQDVTGATLGIVGMGDIGLRIAKRAKAFNMKILYHNRRKRSAEEESAYDATYFSDLRSMLPECDYVLLICPLTPETRDLIDKVEFACMKRTATILNVARGPVINHAALVEALQNRSIRAAALDVTDPEPLPRDHALLRLDNVLITPHIASATLQTRMRMFSTMVTNLKAALIDNRPMPNEVKP